jgi:hypothetical protein
MLPQMDKKKVDGGEVAMVGTGRAPYHLRKDKFWTMAMSAMAWL